MRLLGYQKFENCRRKYYRAVIQSQPFARKRYLRRKNSGAIKAIEYGLDVVKRYDRLFPQT